MNLIPIAIGIAPHERQDAIYAYSKFLTTELCDKILNAPENHWITLFISSESTMIKVETKEAQEN